MSGGGDTPVTNTYVAIYDPGSLSVGQFYVGKIESNTLKYYGSTADGEIFIVDNDGQKVSDTVFDQSLGNTLFQKVKEVYANIAEDKIIDFSLAQGETIPDWSEYVQIGVTPDGKHFLLNATGGTTVVLFEVGVVSEQDSNVVNVAVSSSGKAFMVDANGKVVTDQGPDMNNQQLQNFLIGKLTSAGYSITTIALKQESWSVGYEIENIGFYTQVI